jgi:hypothetical protein
MKKFNRFKNQNESSSTSVGFLEFQSRKDKIEKPKLLGLPSSTRVSEGNNSMNMFSPSK